VPVNTALFHYQRGVGAAPPKPSGIFICGSL